MNAQIDQQLIAPAIWMVVDEDDWSGVNDCGAIYSHSDSLDAINPIDDEIDWPIEQCS